MTDPDAAPPMRILLAEDSYLTRVGVQSLIEVQADMQIVASAEDGAQAVTLYREHRPDVVVCDLRMPKLDGLATITVLCGESPPARVLVLTNYENHVDVFSAVRAGALGFLGKESRGRELVDAIRTVHRGGRYLPPEVVARLEAPAQRPNLTRREQEILERVFAGEANKDIAKTLGISPKTVEMYVTSLLTKLGARSRTDAVSIALRWGFLKSDPG